MSDRLDAPLCLTPRPLRNPRGLQLPEGTCDTHFHVFAAGAPLASPRSYTPQMETVDGWLALADRFGIARGVLVQPSVYGTDNSVLLSALAAHGDRLRGVVVVAPDTPPADLEQMDRLGVRAVRINLRNKAGIGLDALDQLAPSIRRLGWHVVFQVGPDAIGTVAELCAQHQLTGIIDHLAFMPLDPPPLLDDLFRALSGGNVYAKISAPYRLRDTSTYDGYKVTLETLAERYPERLLWGSDWPHTELFDTVPEDDDLIALSLDALPRHTHAAVFARNAESLYWSR